MARETDGVESVVSARRRWGKLYTVTTSSGRRYLVLRDPSSEAFLKAGAALEGAALEALEGKLARTAGLSLAYRLLGVRDRTRREIRDALAKEGIETPEVVDGIVETLRRQGYLDDRRLASHFVEYTAKHRPSGPRLLRRKLREAGVAEEIVEEEVAAALPPEREREAAEALARRKMKGAKSREQAVRRVHAFLLRRGFGERTVNAICAAILRGTFRGEHDAE